MNLLAKLIIFWAVTGGYVLTGCAKLEDSAAVQIDASHITHSSQQSGIEWIGGYRVASPKCTSAPESGSCAKETIDCLKVKKTRKNYTVELYSVQAYQHVCAFDLEMNNDRGALTYSDAKGRKITLHHEGSVLLLQTNGFNPSPGFCGAHASIDGLKFPLSSKLDKDEVCFQDEAD